MNQSDLEEIRHLNDQINNGIMRLAELRTRAMSRAIKYDTIGGSHGGPVNKLELITCMIDEQERRVNRLIDKRYALKIRALHEIQTAGLEIEQRHILFLRYLARDPRSGRCLEWPEIIFYVNKYHNIQKTKIYQLHHDAVAILKNHNI